MSYFTIAYHTIPYHTPSCHTITQHTLPLAYYATKQFLHCDPPLSTWQITALSWTMRHSNNVLYKGHCTVHQRIASIVMEFHNIQKSCASYGKVQLHRSAQQNDTALNCSNKNHNEAAILSIALHCVPPIIQIQIQNHIQMIYVQTDTAHNCFNKNHKRHLSNICQFQGCIYLYSTVLYCAVIKQQVNHVQFLLLQSFRPQYTCLQYCSFLLLL